MKTKYMLLLTVGLGLALSACSSGALYEDMAPSGITSSVEDGLIGVSPSQSFSVTFPKAVDVASVNSSTFFLIASAAQASIAKSYDAAVCDPADAVAGDIECASDTQCSFIPASALESEASYALCLTDTIMYADGNRYPGMMISFTTADAVAPGITSVFPASGATDVAINTTVKAVFSEVMDAASVESAIALSAGGSAIDGSSSYDAASKTLTFTPSANLAKYTQHTATVSRSVKDDAGNSMGLDYSWSFTTSNVLAPQNLSVALGDGSNTVTWDAVSGASSYDLYWGTSSNITTATGTKISNVTSPYSHTGLTNGTRYYYIVTATSPDAGTSAASASANAVPLLDPVGTLDTTFNGVGYATHNGAAGGNGADAAVPILLDSQGRIVVVGRSTNAASNLDIAVWRYKADGTLDTTFNGTGYFTNNGAAGGNGIDAGTALALDSSGRILVAGRSKNASNNYDMVVLRLDEGGTPDATFGTGGIIVQNNAAGGNGDEYVTGLALDSGGRILVVGYSKNATNYDMVIWRFDTSGALDATFGAGGIVVHNNAAGGNGNDFGYSMALDSAGRILVAGQSVNAAGNGDMVIWRYDASGALDATFGTGGIVVHGNAAGGNFDDTAWGISTDSSGRILIGGDSSINAGGSKKAMVIWRYNTDGSLDTTFNGTGFVTHHGAAGGDLMDRANIVVEDARGRLVTAGGGMNAAGNWDMVAWRFKSDGSLDTSFGGTGYVVHNSAAGGNSTDTALYTQIDSTGKIVIAGYSRSASNDDMAVWRYK